ncbi:MAG: sigma-70 family RNA polymerase sigma factor [Candidatus Hydrogenedentales bacterium]|jgi:RNA polymerase sigma factor (sigma-70 family)
MALPTTSELAILAASQRGDRKAYAQLVEDYKNLVCAVTFGTTGDFHASEDLAQETFIAAWRHLDRLRDPRVFRAWICGIARNIGLNWLRKHQRDVLARTEPLENGGHVRDPKPSPRETAMHRENEAIVWQALEKIPEGFRIPIILYYREGRSVEEVAHALGMSDAAVRQRLHRGREFLREQIAEVVESSLSRSRPGSGFTAGVIAAIAAIPVGTAAKAGAAVAGVGAAKGLLGMLGNRSLVASSLWLSAIGGVALLLVVASGWNSKASSGPSTSSSAVAAVVAGPNLVEAEQGAPEPHLPVSEPEQRTDVVVAAVADIEPPEEPAQVEAIVVHPPDAPILNWKDTLKYTGKKGALAGQVLTLDDAPADGAEVEAFCVRGPRVASVGKTHANREGLFTMPLPPANYWIAVRWKDMAGVAGGCDSSLYVVSGESVFAQVRVEPGLAVRGVVLDDASNKPLVGVIVVTSGGNCVRTDASGHFQFDAVHRNRDNGIAVVDDDWYCHVKEFAGGTGPVNLELRARPAGVIHGRVTGPGGAPVKNAPVRLGLSGSVFHLTNYLAETDSRGAYRIYGVNTASNSLPIMVTYDGYSQVNGTAWARFAPGSRDTVVNARLRPDPSAKYDNDMPTFVLASAEPPDAPETASEESSGEVALPSTEGDWVAGRVVDNEGSPLACVTVLSRESQAMTNAQGEFRLVGLPASTRVQVRAISRGDTAPGGTMAELATNREDQLIVVRTPECEVWGRVIDKATRKPIRQFWVKISASLDTDPSDFRCYGDEVLVDSEDGTFQLAGLQAKAGVFGRLTVRAKGYSLKLIPQIKVHSVGNADLDEPPIELTASPMPGGFTGVIVDKATGLPLHDALISIHEADGVADGTFPYSLPFSGWRSTVENFPGSQHATTDAQGVFSFPDWADDKGWIAVECAGYGRYWLHDVPFTVPFKLEMEPEANISGSVYTPKDPNGYGAGITIFRMEGDQAIWNECVPINEDGTFACDRLAPGRYMIHSYGLQKWLKDFVTLSSGDVHQIQW